MRSSLAGGARLKKNLADAASGNRLSLTLQEFHPEMPSTIRKSKLSGWNKYKSAVRQARIRRYDATAAVRTTPQEPL